MIRSMTLLVVLCAALAPVRAQTDSTFSYQGELLEGAMPATGTYDMGFSLWDGAAGGTRIGSTISLPGVSVREGRFVVELDFGAGVFDNSGRWLEISVEGITLSPRHAVTRSPYSVQTRGIFVSDAGDVGIGTTSPQGRVHIEDTEPSLRVAATGDQPSSAGRVELQGGFFPSQFAPLGSLDFLDETGELRAMISGNKSGGSAAQLSFGVVPGEPSQLNIASGRTRLSDRLDVVRGTDLVASAQISGDGSNSFLQALGGNLAIGHEAPTAPLDVMGDARFRGAVGVGTGFPIAPLDVRGNGYFQDRVGIGISSPTAALDVLGDSTFRNRLRVGTTTTSMFGQLNIDDSGAGSIFAISALSNQSVYPTIYADNEANGPVLWALSRGDVELESGGTIVVGETTGANLAMDSNEIMARNNGQASTLYLNNDGGTISMGANCIHPAHAYGKINENGAIVSASSNVTGVSVGTGRFYITIAGGLTNADIVIATDGGYGRPTIINSHVNGSGQLEIGCWGTTNDWDEREPVSFVVYRP
ncbi:MAG: hypothetical protein ACF8R9_07970 [Phycisphaerales bacterium JB054]